MQDTQIAYVESPLQQGLLNCIDSLNVNLNDRKIGKQLLLDCAVLNKSKGKLKLVGTLHKRIIVYKMSLVLQYVNKKSKVVDNRVLYTVEHEIKTNDNERIPSQENTLLAVDRCVLSLQAEMLGLFTIISEQQLKLKDANETRQGN